MTTMISEQSLINAIVQGSPRSRLQCNDVHASDAEILVMPGWEDNALAVTTDAIAEEIASGLYADPALAGWMTVMASMSDLAAVGAEPLGMLVAQTLPRTMPPADVASLHNGIRSALAACSTFLLGGDTNIGVALLLTGTALGVVPSAGRLSRIGCRPGDLLYASGALGSGNAFAAFLYNSPGTSISFHPQARLQEGKILRGIASSCMDTSDGVLATLDQLAKLNNVGFCLAEGWEREMAVEARMAMHALSLPAWFLLAGCHGEFELLFTVPPEREPQLRHAAPQINWRPRYLGTVTANRAVIVPMYGSCAALDTETIRGLWDASEGDVQAYVKSLIAIDASVRAGIPPENTYSSMAFL